MSRSGEGKGGQVLIGLCNTRGLTPGVTQREDRMLGGGGGGGVWGWGHNGVNESFYLSYVDPIC